MNEEQESEEKRKWNVSIAIPQWITLSAVIGCYIFLHGEISSISQRMSFYDQRFDQMHELIYKEMKDFHGRLCKIEENRK